MQNKLHRFFRQAAAALCAAACLLFPVRAAELRAPQVQAKAAALLDGRTGQVLYEKNGSQRALIASTTKIMTGLLVCEQPKLDREVTVPAAAAGLEGSSMYLRCGETISLRALLYGMMLHSGNDAALALAISLCGSEQAFVRQMNCRAVGIEVVSAGDDFSATEVEKLGWLVRKLMAKYGIGASGVIRHYDVTGKLCPAPYGAASKWAALKAAITGGAASGGTTEAAPSGTVEELARAVIRGDYGNDAERKRRLGSFYDAVQARVNKILS